MYSKKSKSKKPNNKKDKLVVMIAVGKVKNKKPKIKKA